MTLATAADFLDAILAEPDRDDLRIIYADWLEENGQPDRCEFIRVQIEASRLEAYVDDWSHSPGRAEDGGKAGAALATAQAMREREKELLATMIDASTSKQRRKERAEYLWAKDALGRHLHVWPFEYRRGFIHSITIPLADWLEHGARIVRCQPVEAVRVSDKRPWNSGNRRWGFSYDSADAEYDGDWWVLPYEIWELLDGYSKPFSTAYRRWWKMESDAVEAMSRACLRFARDAAKRLGPAGVRE